MKERVTCLVGWLPSSNTGTGSTDHSCQKGRLAVVLLLHLQAGILGKAVGSAIAPPYLLCRSRAALWLVWAILGIASRPFGQVFLFAFLQRVLSEVMADGDSEMRFIDAPERAEENLVITVSREERTQNDSLSWADRVENAESHMHQHCRFEYPAHLRSEIYSFDGILPPSRLGELSEPDRARGYRLNRVPNRPCSARFCLSDNAMTAKTILDRITSTGVMCNHVKCIQRLPSGQIEATFATVADHDLFLSKAALVFGTLRSFAHIRTNSSAIYVTVHNVPWELPNNLLITRLRKYCLVYSCRRAFNQSLLPEKVHDGQRLL